MPHLERPQHAQLEILIDKFGLTAVVHALGEICDEKADHIESNWQDLRTGQMWRRKAGQLHMLVSRMNREGDLP